MEREIIREKKVFKPIEIKLKFEKPSEIENILDDLEDASDEGIAFNELNEFFKILTAELKKFRE